VLIGIAILALVISIGNLIYSFWRNHWKSVDFFAEIKLIKKDSERVHGKDEEVNLYLVNKGCPITILDIYFTEGKSTFKMHLDLPPIRLERGEVLKIPEIDCPSPVDLEKINNDSVRFYALDSFEKERWEMRRVRRKAPPHQPYVSQPDNT